jgi:hypothetical protein
MIKVGHPPFGSHEGGVNDMEIEFENILWILLESILLYNIMKLKML